MNSIVESQLSMNHISIFALESFTTARSQPAPVRRRTTTARQMEAIYRRFQTIAELHGHTYLYLPSFYRRLTLSLRVKLHKLKINNAQVLDVHYPDSQVLALLLYTDYIAHVTTAFAAAKIQPYKEAAPKNTHDTNPASDSEDATMDDILDTFLAPSPSPATTNQESSR
ncbi:hypothetical protein G6F56_008988 [Rhizopus delemar]|nr:hypothetical protein G6F56_008988 [Rhizopus delemar]